MVLAVGYLLAIDPQSIRAFINHWFAVLGERQAEALAAMCTPAVAIRPDRARQEEGAPEYHGHAGVREWVASLDGDTTITIELCEIRPVGPDAAVVETEVWRTNADERRGGLTYSVWHFEDGKLREAIGYTSRDAALEAVGIYD